MRNNQVCTIIDVDYENEKVKITNFTDNLLFRAFGVNEHPTWKEFEEFLEDRCVPRTRHMLKGYLEDIGVDFYDPLAIIQKTQGRMAGDQQWIEIVPEKELEQETPIERV